jgi:hypothetical protein
VGASGARVARHAALATGSEAFVAVKVLGAQEVVAKEPQVFLSLADVQVFYSSMEDLRAWGPGTLLLGLERAGVRLGLPRVSLVK